MTVWVKVDGSSGSARWHLFGPMGFNCPQVPDYAKPKRGAVKHLRPNRVCRCCRGGIFF